jgi:predicted TIM-barrel fold metal-dependent hydrolase
MQYRAISADGHVNEPPELWVKNLPAKFRDRGPRIIETAKTKGHAWIMEGQSRPSPMGFSSMYTRGSKRFDRASLIDSFKQIKNRGVRYEDVFPGSYDAKERIKEIIEDQTDAEVIYNGVQTVWNGIKLCPDKELSLACYKVYNDWMVEFQETDPARFICNATLPTTGLQDCMDELRRVVDMGLRTVQLEAYPSGSFTHPTPEDDKFWAMCVEMDIPVNLHVQFFFPAGDLAAKVETQAVLEMQEKQKAKGLDIAAGDFKTVLSRMMASGVFERFPDLKFIGSEVHTGWVPYFMAKWDESVLRNRREWKLPLLPSEYIKRNVWFVYTVDEMGSENRYDIGVDRIMWGPDFPHSSSCWPMDYQVGREVLERAGATEGEIERIMWKTCADLYKLPYDAPTAISLAA